MASVEWVLFDLGGVLVEVVQPRIFSHFEKLTQISSDSIKQRLISDPFFASDLITKEFSPAQVTERVNSALGSELSEHHVVAALNAELGDEIATTAALLPELRRRVKVGCLSNTNSIHWDELLRSYGFMGNFDRRFASQIVGHAKPDPRIYERVAENLGVRPREILFFDDKRENVDTATRLGWHGRVYTDYERLVADLGEFGLA